MKIKLPLIFLLGILFLIFPSSIYAQVLINEFLPNHSSGVDWVELYSSIDIDISGWILVDTTSQMATIPPSTMIGPSSNQFYTIDVGTRLNQSDDAIDLFQSDGLTKVDSKSYNYNPGTDVSFGRYPDGQSWGTCVPTKNSGNLSCIFPTSTPTPTPTPIPTTAAVSTQAPTPSPTIVPTPVPTRAKTPTPKPTKTPTPQPEILGEQASGSSGVDVALVRNELLATPTPSSGDSSVKKFPLLAVIFILLGVGLVGFSVFSFVRASKKGYTIKSENPPTQIS